jgi:hypothetical protein
MKRRLLGCFIATLGVVSAAPIGILDIAGLDVVRISTTEIDFGPLGDGTGEFIVTGRTGGYLAIPPASQGEIADLNIATAAPGPPLAVPINPFILVLEPGALFSFNLEQILVGGGPSCAVAPGIGESCTPSEIVPNSPFLLTQTATGVTVSLSLRGRVTDLTGTSSLPYDGLFTANFTALNQDTVPELLAAFGPAGPGFAESSWSAQLTSIPEPGTWFTMMGALVVFGTAYAARKLRK